MTVDKWDARFLELCYVVAGWSKDRSTQVGCVIVDPESRAIVATGYNGFPRGLDDNVETRHERPAKYMWTEHAERNAVYNAARRGTATLGCTMYMPWFPCCDCARAIVQAGIHRLVCGKPDFDHERWGESWKVAANIMNEAGVQMDFHDA